MIIKNGLVVDGKGTSAYFADIEIQEGLVYRIDKECSLSSEGAIDAKGMVVAPGFIDVHTHLDPHLFWNPGSTPSIWHGVTTVMVGNCGFSLAPVRRDTRNLLIKHYEFGEDLDKDFLRECIPWLWSDFSEYLCAIEKINTAQNVMTQVGHSALRITVLGEDAMRKGYMDKKSLDMMTEILKEALKGGAFGLTSSFSPRHNINGNIPVASRNATAEEIEFLCSLLGSHGAGFQVTSDNPRSGLDDYVFHQYLKKLSLSTSCKVFFGITEKDSQPGSWRKSLETLGPGEDLKGGAFAQIRSSPLTMIFSFRTLLPFDHLEEWKDFRKMSLNKQARYLRSPLLRKILCDSANNAVRSGLYFKYSKDLWSDLKIINKERLSLKEISQRDGVAPIEALINISLDADMQQLFSLDILNKNYAAISEMIEHDHTLLTFTDSGAHVSLASNSALHTHVIKYWVNQRRVLSLESAIQKLSGDIAKHYGLKNRGVIKEGNWADLVIFDEKKISPGVLTLSDDIPFGPPRIIQRAIGIEYVLVNGVVVCKDGRLTSRFPGTLIRANN